MDRIKYNIEVKDVEEESPHKKSSTSAHWAKHVFSGDFLFKTQLRKNPLVFIMYVLVLVLVYIGLRYEPIRRYNTMRKLNAELVNCNYRNNEIKAQLQRYGSAGNIEHRLKKDGKQFVFAQPTIIKVSSDSKE